MENKLCHANVRCVNCWDYKNGQCSISLFNAIPEYRPDYCPECHGQTVFFRGSGKDAQYRLCSHWTKPGHKDDLQIKAEIEKVRQQEYPSGRMA